MPVRKVGTVRGGRVLKPMLGRYIPPPPSAEAIDLISSSDDEDALVITGLARGGSSNTTSHTAATTSQRVYRSRPEAPCGRAIPIFIGDDDLEETPPVSVNSQPSGRRRPNLFSSGVPLAALSVPFHAPHPAATAKSPPSSAARHCAICLEAKQRPACPPCGHTFCYDCLSTTVKKTKLCPICRKACNVKQLIRIYD